ncbi:MAG: bifunctional 2-methylcitrate dehydratase/aconitate hydratase [Legionellales bacterium]|jgi:2-methylcitrate dehydratase
MKTDQLLIDIADYVCNKTITSDLAYETARLCLLDALGCAALALQFPECKRLLGPIVPDTQVPNGVHVPGTTFRLDPIKAAFDIGTLIRWNDFNDTWLAKEWGHPSDNLGAILAVADFVAQRSNPDLTMHDVLTAMIKAYEIQGVLALENAFNELGLDHVILVKIASTAVVTHLLGGNHQQVIDAVSQAFLDGQSLRTYRHAPNTASRKSWAAGDATSRAVRLAMLTLQGEPGYPKVLTGKLWGFNDVYLNGQNLKVSRPFDSYVIENILFKVAYPAEFHAQTAVEAALILHSKINQLIEKVEIQTQDAAMRIINKQGVLNNPADRDHCLQYMVAVALLQGELTAQSYSDDFANQHQQQIDALRDTMVVTENKQMTHDYYDPTKRAIANAVVVHLSDGTVLREQIDYPLGHIKRRHEALPLIEAKAQAYLSDPLFTLIQGPKRFNEVSVKAFCELAQQILR